jgi:hypothetical protein
LTVLGMSCGWGTHISLYTQSSRCQTWILGESCGWTPRRR